MEVQEKINCLELKDKKIIKLKKDSLYDIAIRN
jgi:hypothetical protein